MHMVSTAYVPSAVSWPALQLHRNLIPLSCENICMVVQRSQAQPYAVSTLTVTDAHGGVNQCAAKINITDVDPPAWKSAYSLANATNPFSGNLSDISQLCIWPPNLQYYCWLDVTANNNDQVPSPLHCPACCRAVWCPGAQPAVRCQASMSLRRDRRSDIDQQRHAAVGVQVQHFN